MSIGQQADENSSALRDSPKLNHVTSLDEVLSENGQQSSTGDKMIYQSASITFTLKSKHDSIARVLRLFKRSGATVTSVDRLSDAQQYKVHFVCDSPRILCEMVNGIKRHSEVEDSMEYEVDGTSSCSVPWFPRTLSDLDKCAKNVLMYGSELDADHPGFKDEEYRKRRKIFTDIALNYAHGDPIPRIEYTEEEVRTWGKVYKELTSLYPAHACKQHVVNLPLLSLYCDYGEETVPQLEDVSRFLQQRTGFRLRPVAGFLQPRDFLAGLAFRVFNCTQYIRHSSDPFYTPEPDLCHELLGHVPLLADPDFAQFNQEIGLASLGASDADISRLATCYLFTVEFGLCKENGDLRAFGAGLLSSIGELKHALSSPEKIRLFDAHEASTHESYVTSYQPVYFLSQSVKEAKDKMKRFFESIQRPFHVAFEPLTCSLRVTSGDGKPNEPESLISKSNGSEYLDGKSNGSESLISKSNGSEYLDGKSNGSESLISKSNGSEYLNGKLNGSESLNGKSNGSESLDASR